MSVAMQVEETLNEGLKREYKIVVAAKEIAIKIDQRLEEIGKTAKMAGFRPGKIPSNVLKKRYGSSVMGEVLEQTVAQSSQKALVEKKVRPALQPKIEISSYDEGKDLEYTIALEIFPDVPEIDLEKMELLRWAVEVSEEDLQKGLERVQKANKAFEKPEDDAAKAGDNDVVLIDFVGRVDGEVFEGGSAESFRLELGSGQFIDGFEGQLVGSKAGDEVIVKVTFPENYGNADLSSKDAEFTVTIKEVNQAVIPEINAAFAERLGFESLEKLNDAVKEQIQKDYSELSRSKVKKELFDALDDAYPFPVPHNMVDLEFDSLWQQVQKDKEKNPELAGKSDEELNTEFRAMAERRVRLGILLAETGRRNEIEVEQDALRKAIYDQARSFPGQEKEVIEFYQKNKDAIEQLKGPILEEKVVDFLLEKVKIEDKAVPAKELLDYFAVADDNKNT